jgi:zinc protease
MRKTWFALVFLSVAAAANAAEGTQKVATVEGVTEYRLANGARVVLYPEPSRDSVTVNMTVLVGSRREGYGEAGMAHLLEHMVFKGTPTHPMVPKALRDHGASFNGTTNVDRTNYFETLRATDENLEFAIALEADRLVNSYVKREDLISEMTVVRNEFEIGENNPAGVLMERIHAAAYAWHNYGKTTIGNRADIERVPIENLQAFYKKYYQPDNCVLIVAGKFEEPKALALCEKYLGAIPKPDRKLTDAYTEEPPQDGERTVYLRRVGTVGSVGVAYHMPSASHPDWAPLNILGGIISQSPNGRLYKALVESKLATNASGRAGNNHDPGLFIANASAEPDKLNLVRDVLVKTLETLGETPFTQEEVDRARVRNKRADEMLASNAQAMSQALSSSAALGDWRLHFVQRDRIAAVTADDVNRVAKTYFHPANRTVGIYTPEKAPNRVAVAAAPPIESIVKDYKGGTVTAAGEAFDAAPANLDKRLKVVEEGALKAGLLEKKNRGETVSLVITLHYGNEESLKGLTTAAGMMPGLMMAGTKKHDRQQLREELDSLGVVISPGAGGFGGGRGGPRRGGGGGGGGMLGQLTFSVQAKKDTLPKALELLGEILREPAFPEAEFETQKARMRQGMAGSTTEPGTLARNRLDRALSPYDKDDIRYVPTIEESIARAQAVTLEQVKAVYDQVGASKVELAVVGEFDPDATVAKVKEIVGNWQSKTPVRRVERKAPREVPGSKDDINTPDKANATYLAGLAFPLKESDPDFVALRLGNVILGGSTLASRLGDRIRQKEGLSYGATSQFNASTQDPVATLTVSVNTNPTNMQRVDVCVAEELERFVKDGPSLTELTDAKNAFLEGQKVGRTTDAAIAGTIVSHLNLGRTFAYDAEQEKRIEALTPEAVKAAFQKHVDPKKLVIIRAGDFKK